LDIVFVRQKDEKGMHLRCWDWVLSLCRESGESRVLLTCDKENVASQRAIIKNGGVMENEIVDTAGLSESGIIQRFWILI